MSPLTMAREATVVPLQADNMIMETDRAGPCKGARAGNEAHRAT